jgi:hypothetical protein
MQYSNIKCMTRNHKTSVVSLSLSMYVLAVGVFPSPCSDIVEVVETVEIVFYIFIYLSEFCVILPVEVRA